jgi:hypothetical protein
LMARPRLDRKIIVLDRFSDDGIQDVRKRKSGGPTAVHRSSWRDPDDTSPTAAKTARQVTGYRTFCPLRRIAQGRSSSITDAHIHAADMLRKSADAAGIGFSAEREAARDFKRAVRPFGPDQLQMIQGILLRNWAVERWCHMENARTGRKIDPRVEMGKLLAILEILAAYYKTDIEEGLANGRILPIA